MDTGSKVAAESSESVGFLDILGSKSRRFFRKWNLIFWKQLSLDILMSTATETISQSDAECEQNSEISQNVQNLFFFCKKGWVFRKKLWNVRKSLMVTNLLYNAKELVRFLKTFKFWDLEVSKNTSVFREKLKSFKMVKAAILP